MMDKIFYFACGLLAYYLTYGQSITGREITFILYILFGVFSLLYWLFFTIGFWLFIFCMFMVIFIFWRAS